MTRTTKSRKGLLTMLFRFCWLNRHQPDRQHASWDGHSFVSTCTQCGAAIRRHKKNVWHKEWMEQSDDALPSLK